MNIQSVLSEIKEKYYSRAGHAFLLHLNVYDSFLFHDARFPLMDLKEALVFQSVLSKASFVLFFDLARGINFVSQEAEDEFLGFLQAVTTEIEVKKFHEGRYILGYALSLFSRLLRYKKKDHEHRISEEKSKRTEFLFAVVFEHMDTLIPPESTSGKSEDRQALVAVLNMAQDKAIERADNILIMIAESLTTVSAQLKIETNGIIPIKVGFPDNKERRAVFDYLGKEFETALIRTDSSILSSNSSGLSCNNILKIVRVSNYLDSRLDIDKIFREKKKFIEDASGGLLEIQRPLWGIEAIGSLEEYKDYLLEVVDNMKNKRFAAVPSGILLIGAQGTGKTVFVQAMAHEAEVPMVVMKNTREMWVGSSERNLEFSLELIRVMAPVIVFMDEIDQEFVRRGSYSGDSGVTQRIQSRLFRFMSDTDLRGHVLWIAASNLPHILDSALIREGRFDDRVPFFSQPTLGRVEIVGALFNKLKIIARDKGEELNLSEDITSDFVYEFARMAHAHIETEGEDKRVRRCTSLDHDLDDRERDDELYYTGAQLEAILSRAFRRSVAENMPLSKSHLLYVLQNDYIPPVDMLTHEELSRAALLFTNSARFLPRKGKWANMAKAMRVSEKHSKRTELDLG